MSRSTSAGKRLEHFEVILTPIAQVTYSARLWIDQYKLQVRLIIPTNVSKK